MMILQDDVQNKKRSTRLLCKSMAEDLTKRNVFRVEVEVQDLCGFAGWTLTGLTKPMVEHPLLEDQVRNLRTLT